MREDFFLKIVLCFITYKGREPKTVLNQKLLINSFSKTEAAVFSCRLCFLRAFPFTSLVMVSAILHNLFKLENAAI